MIVVLAPQVAAQNVMTAHDVARLRTVAEVAIAPDASRTAYAVRVPRQPMSEEDGPEWVELHVISAAGESRPYVTGRVNVSRIGWTPDGKGISFLARRGTDRTTSLYLIPVEGGEARRVLSHATNITSYSWSPDGKRVAFLATEPEPEAAQQRRQKGFNQEIYEEEFRPARVWTADLSADGAKPRMLNLSGSASDVEWSPAAPSASSGQGAQLAVVLAPTPSADDSLMSRKVQVVDADSGRVVANLNNPGKLGQIAWSRDGKHLAIVSAADINDPSASRLMVAPATGGPLRDLLPGYEGDVAAIAWMDADTVMYVTAEGVWSTFGRVRRDGTDKRTIVSTGGPILTAISLARDGQSAAFIANSPQHPSEVYWMKHGEAGPRRVTDSNPWLARERTGAQEVVKYKARDGLDLEGLLIRPLDEQKGKRYPLILVVHGGPEAHYSNGWLTGYSNPGQVAAGRGFMVFYPNYRGSTGRGVAFSKLSQGDPAGKEFDDYVDGVDHLINAGLVDRAHVGITGGSYGGYASAWGATFYSDRFAASVMFVGISDGVSKIGTTDIPKEMYYVHYLYWQWDKWQKTLERSPIYYADKSRTPTLILGGKDDPRVHPSQSLELYRHLKLRGKVPVRLIWYPGEQHGNRRAASRLDYNLRMMQWMEHYLIGPGGDPPSYEISYAEAGKQ